MTRGCGNSRLLGRAARSRVFGSNVSVPVNTLLSMWTPRSEGDIRAAINAGELVESHLLELKREAGGSKGERSEIARDLASFALDGGAILYGVAEIKEDHRFELAPIALDGRIEALEQIAELRIEPPLTIRAIEIPSVNDPAAGYLFVTVDATTEAPHMVDGVYYGRGERRRRRLGDAEVRRLHALRAADSDRVLAALEEDIAADPTPKDRRSLAHLHLIAIPIAGRQNLAEDLVWDRNRLRELFRGASSGLTRDLAEWAPTPSYASNVVNREYGLAWTSLRTEDDRIDEDSLVDVEFREDGSIHVLVGRLTADISRGTETGRFAIMDGLLVAYAIRIVNLAAAVAEATGYTGSWDFGLAGSGLKPAPAYSSAINWRSFESSMYMSANYRESTRASRVETREQPAAVARRLLIRFLRSLGLVSTYEGVLAAPAAQDS